MKLVIHQMTTPTPHELNEYEIDTLNMNRVIHALVTQNKGKFEISK
jgi:hypothetical protein